MERVSYFGLQDLWNDFLNIYKEETVDLKEMQIYQVHKIRHTQQGYIATVNLTDVRTMQRKEGQKAKIPAGQIDMVEQIGVLYKYGKQVYIPTTDVKNRIFGDYFRVNGKSITVKPFSDADTVLALAKQFVRTGKIIFITKQIGGYRCIVGMKSTKQKSPVNLLYVMQQIRKLYGEDIPIYTDYISSGAKSPMDFQAVCKVPLTTKDGGPLFIAVRDGVSVRSPVLLDFVTNLKGRFYILDSVSYSHKSNGAGMMETIQSTLQRLTEKELGQAVDIDTIKSGCMNGMQKNIKSVFLKELEQYDTREIAGIYDALEATFKSIQKQHKTTGYDMGKRKAERTLGSMLG